MCCDFPRDSSYFASHLVFRPCQEDSSEDLHEFAPLSLELVFRHIPGKSVQWWWMARCRPLPFRQRCPLLHPVRDGVLRIAPAPRRLRLCTPLPLAFLFRARVLPRTHPLIRPEPSSAKPAWPFLEPRVHRSHGCRESESPPTSRLRPRPLRPPAYFCRADPDYFSRAAKHLA
jgi:hypothetical protein